MFDGFDMLKDHIEGCIGRSVMTLREADVEAEVLVLEADVVGASVYILKLGFVPLFGLSWVMRKQFCNRVALALS